MITSSDRKLHVCYASAGTGARGAVHGLCALAIAVSAYVRATAMQSHVVVASVNSKTELIGILRTLPGGDSNVPSSWRARPPVTTGTKRKGV